MVLWAAFEMIFSEAVGFSLPTVPLLYLYVTLLIVLLCTPPQFVVAVRRRVFGENSLCCLNIDTQRAEWVTQNSWVLTSLTVSWNSIWGSAWQQRCSVCWTDQSLVTLSPQAIHLLLSRYSIYNTGSVDEWRWKRNATLKKTNVVECGCFFAH